MFWKNAAKWLLSNVNAPWVRPVLGVVCAGAGAVTFFAADHTVADMVAREVLDICSPAAVAALVVPAKGKR